MSSYANPSSHGLKPADTMKKKKAGKNKTKIKTYHCSQLKSGTMASTWNRYTWWFSLLPSDGFLDYR